MDEDLGAGAREVLRLCAIARRAGDIRFLYGEGGRDSSSVSAWLKDLEERGLATEGGDGLWRQTSKGTALLRHLDRWSAVVEDVFSTSGRRRPLVVCSLRSGAIYADDWFLVNSERLGRVISVEFPPRGAAADAVTLTLDVNVEPGDVLEGHEPLAA